MEVQNPITTDTYPESETDDSGTEKCAIANDEEFDLGI